MAILVTLEESDVSHVSVQLFIVVLEVFIVESLIGVDMHIFVLGINRKHIVMKICIIMNMSLSPAIFP